MPNKPLPLISPNHWPSRRPDGQTANPESDPAPPVKGSSNRPGVEKITVRVPTQKARKFKQYCAFNGLEQKDVIEELLDHLFESLSGRPDGQTAIYQIEDDLTRDEEVTSSSNLPLTGRPDGPAEATAKRRAVLAYYVRLTGNQIRQNDRDYLETILDFPLWIIRCGIAKSVFLCKTHVGSLRYCNGAILEIRDAGISEDYFQHVERALRRTGKLADVEPQPSPPGQPALPGASDAGELIDLPRKDKE